MNIMKSVTWKAMWQNKARTVVTVIGIIVSAAMFTAVTTLVFSLWDFMVRGEIYEHGDYYLQFNFVPDDQMEALSREEDITQLADCQVLGFLKTQENSNGPMSTFLLSAADATFFATMPTHLTEGRLPQNSSEIVLPERIIEILDYYGMPTGIGETITLDLITDFDEYPESVSVSPGGGPFTKAYTVVGHIKENLFQDYALGLYTMLTFSDGNQGTALWHRVFLKTAPQKALEFYKLPYGYDKDFNSTLLGYHGVTQFSNFNQIITALAAVLCAIIMVGSVSLIYNAFSISVSERTKQFGLLSSIGATRKQLRGAVFHEALVLSAMGIPLGLLSGYAGIAVTLKLLSTRVDAMFSRGDGTITLRAILSPEAWLLAAAVALVTVWISAAIPARRAAGISPVDAIRQVKDHRAPKKPVKIGKLTYRLFGLPGVLGKKYYTVSRKKYRATVISLAISFILFVSAASFSQTLRSTVETNMDTESFDIRCGKDYASHEALRKQDFISQSAYAAESTYMACVTDSQRSAEFLEQWETLKTFYSDLNKNVCNLRIFYLEDAVLEGYLAEQKIPSAGYLDPENPLALVCAKNIQTYAVKNETDEYIRYTYCYAPFAEDTGQLRLLIQEIPDSLPLPEGEGENIRTMEYSSTESGEPLLLVKSVEVVDGLAEESTENAYLIRLDSAVPGKTTASFYSYDIETGTASTEAAATEVYDVPRFSLGATVDTLPYGIPSSVMSSYYYTCVILPLSSAPDAVREDAHLYISVSDYPAAVSYLNANFEQYEYIDHRSGEESNRTLLYMINVFSYGFIVLISLISIANVFNTISTNVALRRRDFGMLRSTGFREKDLLRMMRYECLTYGTKALLWGIPPSLLISYLIHYIDQRSYTARFTPPWAALLIASVSIFAVVFVTMFYAMSKLRRDDPIDAIRMENI